MVVDDIRDYRDDRYITIALIDDDPEDATWHIMHPGYDIDKPDSSLLEVVNKELLMEYAIRKILLPSHKARGTVVPVFQIMSSIYTFGGVNINPLSGGWKAFIKLT